MVAVVRCPFDAGKEAESSQIADVQKGPDSLPGDQLCHGWLSIDRLLATAILRRVDLGLWLWLSRSPSSVLIGLTMGMMSDHFVD